MITGNVQFRDNYIQQVNHYIQLLYCVNETLRFVPCTISHTHYALPIVHYLALITLSRQQTVDNTL